MCSPIDDLGKDLVHVRILLPDVIDDTLDRLITLTLLFEVLAGLLLGNGGLELI